MNKEKQNNQVDVLIAGHHQFIKKYKPIWAFHRLMQKRYAFMFFTNFKYIIFFCVFY